MSRVGQSGVAEMTNWASAEFVWGGGLGNWTNEFVIVVENYYSKPIIKPLWCCHYTTISPDSACYCCIAGAPHLWGGGTVMNYIFPDLLMCLLATLLAHLIFQWPILTFDAPFDFEFTFEMPPGHPSHSACLIIHPIGSLKVGNSLLFSTSVHTCIYSQQPKT